MLLLPAVPFQTALLAYPPQLKEIDSTQIVINSEKNKKRKPNAKRPVVTPKQRQHQHQHQPQQHKYKCKMASKGAKPPHHTHVEHEAAHRHIAQEAPYNHIAETDAADYTAGQFRTGDKTAVLPIRYSKTGFASEVCPPVPRGLLSELLVNTNA